MAFALRGTWNHQQDELALDEVDLPLGTLGMMPIGISAQLRFPAAVAGLAPPTISSVEMSVGAGGIFATVDAVDVGVHWDAELLSNLAEVADAFGIGPGEENTFCHGCGRLLIRRAGYWILENRIRPDGRCPDCGTPVAGVGMPG